MYYSLVRDILKICILLTHFLKEKGMGFNWLKKAKGGSDKIYKCSESVFKSSGKLPQKNK